MKICRYVLLTAAFCSIFSQSAYAKARFMGLEELVAVSDVIAVIEVIKSEKMGEQFDKGLPKKGFWNYAQRNKFKFIEFIKVQKGAVLDTKKPQILWAKKSFVCASASYAKGRYLVFLENVGENEWITLNDHLGGLAVDGKGDVAGFGFYREKGYSEAVDIKESKEAILKALIDKEQVSFYARIDPAFKPIYNVWREGCPFQKLWLHIEEYTWIEEKYTKTEIIGKWPRGLTLFVRGFINTDDIKRKSFEKMIEKGGTFQITGIWEKGYLYLRSIQNKETKEHILK